MNRVGWMVAVLLVGVGLSAWADCGCAPAGDPTCYTAFVMNRTIEFSVTVPLDYFVAHATTETPFLTGWRIETLAGVVVRRVTFDFPLGLVTVLEWNLDDDAGARVADGFYRLIVETTSAGEITDTIRLISCCNPCGCIGRSPVCRPACGSAYLILRAGESLGCCCGCSFSLFGSAGAGAP
ncbi:MAG: hypothetical protein NTY63_00130 [Candidatus Bipolaricaulota bacterium]|nr:hypothetical protein [Candidatus Bipolaricaulota bacterium]